MIPTVDLNLECHVDSDFCGLHGKEERTDPTSVKSQTGFVISIAGCPIVWKSTLQSSIATSTMHAEYLALSSAMRELLPLLTVLREVAKSVGLPDDFVTQMRTTVWEDNMGALTLANKDPGQHTPRSKWYDVRVHWFRSQLKPNRVTVLKIDTAEQKADIFTKPLVPVTFVKIRRLLVGW